ncbi:hypothetical protein [Nocardioides yefusunii]|uniref:Htaa domain-containing protein n=1 Tax=Nocardioides yefusunii TaxID=2500546 RepID=A0ABW1QX50_9ACTN|nr:hypothetical protein [Nocardioides yefusunii]
MRLPGILIATFASAALAATLAPAPMSTAATVAATEGAPEVASLSAKAPTAKWYTYYNSKYEGGRNVWVGRTCKTANFKWHAEARYPRKGWKVKGATAMVAITDELGMPYATAKGKTKGGYLITPVKVCMDNDGGYTGKITKGTITLKKTVKVKKRGKTVKVVKTKKVKVKPVTLGKINVHQDFTDPWEQPLSVTEKKVRAVVDGVAATFKFNPVKFDANGCGVLSGTGIAPELKANVKWDKPYISIMAYPNTDTVKARASLLPIRLTGRPSLKGGPVTLTAKNDTCVKDFEMGDWLIAPRSFRPTKDVIFNTFNPPVEGKSTLMVHLGSAALNDINPYWEPITVHFTRNATVTAAS